MSRVAVNGHVKSDWRPCIDGVRSSQSQRSALSLRRRARGVVHLSRDVDIHDDHRNDGRLAAYCMLLLHLIELLCGS